MEGKTDREMERTLERSQPWKMLIEFCIEKEWTNEKTESKLTLHVDPSTQMSNKKRRKSKSHSERIGGVVYKTSSPTPSMHNLI